MFNGFSYIAYKLKRWLIKMINICLHVIHMDDLEIGRASCRERV